MFFGGSLDQKKKQQKKLWNTKQIKMLLIETLNVSLVTYLGCFIQYWLHKIILVVYRQVGSFKGDSNINNKYVLSERALWTTNFDTSIIKIGWKMGKLWAFKKFNMANI